jgi:BirA family biotin operon repressor/biotin-[acetyl-CoA-carboxylase] ligase
MTMNETTDELDELSEKAIRKDLTVRTIGRSVIYHKTLPSTMDAAREAARNGAPEGTVVVAGAQTRGRGRMRRPWQTPEGNVAVSIVLYLDTAALPYLVMMASLAAARAIEEATGLDTALKWPNDVLVNGKKVCGILVENEVRSDRPATAIVGIGINIELDPAALGEVVTPATSLRAETTADVSRAELVRRLLEAFDGMYGAPDDYPAVYAAWKEKLATLGEHVTVTWKDAVKEGVAEDVDETGALLFRDDDGELTTVVAGDVTLRMPAPPEPEEEETPEEEAEETGEPVSPEEEQSGEEAEETGEESEGPEPAEEKAGEEAGGAEKAGEPGEPEPPDLPAETED